ncbi:hypothetical protein I4U23_030884 [Adineta vaga]|nr:hypothetical protein I4U23_030884 [Adineta vaga]
MPKSRNKNNSNKNGSNAPSSKVPVPLPLLDSPRGLAQSTMKSDTNDSKISVASWQCEADDWFDMKVSSSTADKFPQSIRSLERKHEQTKSDFFKKSKAINNENVSNEALKRSSSNDIDLSKLSQLVTDLITGKDDDSTYVNFLSILQYFSVHATRDDHLEETVYHLIQAAVTFIRSDPQRFDLSKLDECYRRRHFLKTNSLQHS